MHISFTKFVYEYHLKHKIGLCCIYHDWQFHYISIYILKYQICWKSLISYHWSLGPECPGRVKHQVRSSFGGLSPTTTCQTWETQSNLDAPDTSTTILPCICNHQSLSPDLLWTRPSPRLSLERALAQKTPEEEPQNRISIY